MVHKVTLAHFVVSICLILFLFVSTVKNGYIAPIATSLFVALCSIFSFLYVAFDLCLNHRSSFACACHSNFCMNRCHAGKSF